MASYLPIVTCPRRRPFGDIARKSPWHAGSVRRWWLLIGFSLVFAACGSSATTSDPASGTGASQLDAAFCADFRAPMAVGALPPQSTQTYRDQMAAESAHWRQAQHDAPPDVAGAAEEIADALQRAADVDPSLGLAQTLDAVKSILNAPVVAAAQRHVYAYANPACGWAEPGG